MMIIMPSLGVFFGGVGVLENVRFFGFFPFIFFLFSFFFFFSLLCCYEEFFLDI